MIKCLIFLVSFAFFSSCLNSKSDSSNNSIKNVAYSHKSSNFAFEAYIPAGPDECVNGGWKLVPTSKAGDLSTGIKTQTTLFSCVSDHAAPEIMVKERRGVIGEPPRFDTTGSIPTEDFLINYELVCTKGDPALNVFPLSLTKHITTDCQTFAQEVTALYNSGVLDLTKDGLYAPNETVDILAYEKFAPYTKHLKIDVTNISNVAKLRNFDRLIKIEITSKTKTTDIWEFIPASIMSIRVYNSQLAEIENLDHLLNVEKLLLQGNRFTSIPVIKSLPKLAELDLRQNQIEVATNLNFEPKTMLKISLTNNPIKDFGLILYATAGNQNFEIESDAATKQREIAFK